MIRLVNDGLRLFCKREMLVKNSLVVIALFFSFFAAFPYRFKKISVFSDRVKSRTGPSAVQQSLLAGLRVLDVPFNCNPSESELGDVVIVLSGVNNFKRAISWKQQKRIACLLGGPNVMNRPCDYNYLFTSKEVDICLVPSDWIRIAYEEDALALKGRVRCWPAGVDVDFWNPASGNRDCVLVYWKTESESFCQSVEKVIKKHGYTPIRIRYGSYDSPTYRRALNRAKFSVFISRSESQGMALAESWSMDVPSFVWDPGTLTYLGRSYSVVSACPYLTESTGNSWKQLEELDQLIRKFGQNKYTFTPRQWVLNNMSNAVTTQYLLRMIEGIR